MEKEILLHSGLPGLGLPNEFFWSLSKNLPNTKTYWDVNWLEISRGGGVKQSLEKKDWSEPILKFRESIWSLYNWLLNRLTWEFWSNWDTFAGL